MYSYDDIKNLKNNLELIVHQASPTHQLPTIQDQKAIFKLLELIDTYELLLDLIAKFGVSVIDENVTQGLKVTENLLTKLKRNEDTI